MKNGSSAHEARVSFVEEVGLVFQEAGLPRMAGRIMGWLLISDPPHQSASELCEALGASKGSISTMTRLLVQLGLVKRVAVPEDRKTYVRIRPGHLSDLLAKQVGQMSTLRQLAERGLAVLSNGGGDPGRLEEMYDFYAFMEREMPVLLERWKEERRSSPDGEQVETSIRLVT